jgi:hypothetical protein
MFDTRCGASLDEYGDLAFMLAVVPHFSGLIGCPRTMTIVFASRLSHLSQTPERKATCPSRPISGLRTKTLTGKRFQQ